MANNASISNFTPTGGLAGATVTINGVGFTGAIAVKISGLAATSFVVVSDTKITAVVPAAITSGNIHVSLPTGTIISAFNWIVTTP